MLPRGAIAKIELVTLLNGLARRHLPRKVLNFKTPSEVFNYFTGALAP